jgi:hypothetical protein
MDYVSLQYDWLYRIACSGMWVYPSNERVFYRLIYEILNDRIPADFAEFQLTFE